MKAQQQLLKLMLRCSVVSASLTSLAIDCPPEKTASVRNFHTPDAKGAFMCTRYRLGKGVVQFFQRFVSRFLSASGFAASRQIIR